MRWRLMEAGDLTDIHVIADRIHLNHPEDLAVLAERQQLFPAGCHVLEQDTHPVGYAIGHPWEFGKPPALNTTLGILPATPTTFYIHDVAILDGFRGHRQAAKAVGLLADVARDSKVDNLSLVAVNGSQAIWERMGFVPANVPGLATKLRSYGDGAVFMVRKLEEPAR